MPDNNVVPVGTLKPLNDKTGVKPVGQLKPLAVKPERNPYYDVFDAKEHEGDTDRLINNIPDMDDDHKEIIRDLAKKGGTKEEISQSIQALSNNRPQGERKYYLNDRGVAIALKNDEKPPKQYEVASIWGTQKDAEDDNPLTTVAKSIYNILPSAAENIVDLVHLPVGMTTGEEGEWYKKLKNSANYLKMATSSDSKAPVFNTEGIDEVKDIFDSNRWNFNADNVAGTVGTILKSVGEFYLGGELAKPILGANKAFQAGKAGTAIADLSKVQKYTAAFTGSYMTQLGEVIDRGKEAGLDNKDAYRLASAITIPLALVDMATGVEGRILKDATAKTERQVLVDNLVKGYLKDTEGKITKESLDELFKATVIGNTSLVKTWGKETLKDVVGEGTQEAAQEFVQKAGEQLWDKLSDKEKAKFGTDAFSPKAFADYIQNAVVGAIGGAPTGVAYNKIKAITKDNEQSKTAFGLVQKGDDAINSYKKNIFNEVKQGKMTQQEADYAVTKINAYKQYNDVLGATDITPEEKRKVFDLSFQKQNIETELMDIKDTSKLDPIALAKYRTKEKLADDLQKNINEIIFKAQVKEETVLGEKTITDVAKKEEKEAEAKNKKTPEGKHKKQLPEYLQAIVDKHKKDPSEIKDLRSYHDIPRKEFNKNSFNSRVKHAKVAEYLESQPEKMVVGKLKENPFDYEGPNRTYSVVLPDGKEIRVASSMIRKDSQLSGHFRTEHTKGNELKINVGVKVYSLPSGKKAIKVYHGDSGKFITWAKATHKGKEDVTPEDKETLEELQMGTEPPVSGNKFDITPITTGPLGDGSISNVSDLTSAEVKPKAKKNVQQVKPTKEEFISQSIESLKNDPDAQYDETYAKAGLYDKIFANKYDKQYGETKNANTVRSEEGSESGTTESVTGQDGGKTEEGKSRKLKLRTKRGTKKSKRKIIDPVYIKALGTEVYNPFDLVLQYFIGGGKINYKSIENIFKGRVERRSKLRFTVKGAPTSEQIAESIKANNPDLQYDMDAYVDAVEEAMARFGSEKQMAEDILRRYEVKLNPSEQVLADTIESVEGEGLSDALTAVVEAYEELPTESLIKMDDEGIDIILRDDIGDVTEYFQKKEDEYESQVENKLSKFLTENYDQAKEVYIKTFGLVLDTDAARSFSEEYNKLPELLAGATHKPASDFVAKIYSEEVVKDAPKGKENIVLFTAGGGGSGKSRAIEKTNINAHIVVDGTLSNYEYAKVDIDTALKNGKKVKIFYTYRNPFDSFINGVVPRSIRTGRAVPYNVAVEANKNSLKTIIQLSEHYKDNPNIEISYRDNNFNKENAKPISLNNVKTISPNYDLAKTNIKNEIERLYTQGKLTKEQYYGLTGQNIRGLVEKGLAGENERSFKSSSKNRGKTFSESISDISRVEKVVEVIQKSLPKIKVIFDPNLRASGRLKGDTITINPYYAGTDTPIHEAAHVLLDAMGDNKVVQAAIDQLKGTELWKETEARYPELDGDSLANEVLAEAIGREGAGIFEDVNKQNKFMQLLNYIFDWFKTKLGLNKNIAKSLAKQIVSGIGTSELGDETMDEKLQKPKEEVDEETQKRNDLKLVEEYLASPDISEEDRVQLELVRKNIMADFSGETKAKAEAKRKIEDVLSAEDLEKFSLDDLIQTYNDALDSGDSAERTDVMKRIAFYLNETRRRELKDNNLFSAEAANKNDLSWKDVNFRVLSHMTQEFPELQALSPMFDKAYFDKVSEANKMKAELEKKAKAVIKEYNKKLGVADKVLGLFSSNNAKYFEYMDQDGKLATNTRGMTNAQIELLDHMKQLMALKEKQFDEHGNEIAQDDILKIDRSFKEDLKTEGMMWALSNYFGGANLYDQQITYVNPKGIRETTSYLDAQKAIISHYSNNPVQKVIALGKLLALAYNARKASAKAAYAFNFNGRLTNKFDRPRNKDAGYSKDFYKAALMFVDEYTHVKHMNKFVPIVNSLDHLYSQGYGEVLKKPNAKKWLEEWSQAQIYRTDKVTDPAFDIAMKFIRTLTSQVVMGFGITAAAMNVFMGLYNNWRISTGKMFAVGNKRMFGKDGINKYAIDVIQKYDVVKSDTDSNPRVGFGKLFQKLAFAAQSLGEYHIQGSMFLGLMTDEEWNSFEYNKDGDLVVKKGVNEDELIKKFNEYKNTISDIQGKYSSKDRRNFLRSEYGKTILQFKVWMPDAFKERFGRKYVNYKGEVKQGSFNALISDGFAELRNDFNSKGIKGVWENKTAMANLKGAMMVCFFMVLKYQDDDDDKKRKSALSASNALGNLLFIFDTDQLKYMAKSPVASLGTVGKFIESFEDLAKLDGHALNKDVRKVIPNSKLYGYVEDVFTEE